MSPAVKFLIGLIAVLLMGWIHHGPLGNGERLVRSLEQQAQAAVAGTGLDVNVQLDRDPLSRRANLSGSADAFQREGQGSLKGINDLVAEVPGISGIRWADEPDGARVMPLLAESLLQILVAYLVGLAFAWVIWGRKRREGYY